jgi:hypothetical protein
MSKKTKVDISVEIKPNVAQVAKKIYYINDIHVIADYGDLRVDTTNIKQTNYQGIDIQDPSTDTVQRCLQMRLDFVMDVIIRAVFKTFHYLV